MHEKTCAYIVHCMCMTRKQLQSGVQHICMFVYVQSFKWRPWTKTSLDIPTRFPGPNNSSSAGSAARPAWAVGPVLLQLGLHHPLSIDHHRAVRVMNLLRQRVHMRSTWNIYAGWAAVLLLYDAWCCIHSLVNRTPLSKAPSCCHTIPPFVVGYRWPPQAVVVAVAEAAGVPWAVFLAPAQLQHPAGNINAKQGSQWFTKTTHVDTYADMQMHVFYIHMYYLYICMRVCVCVSVCPYIASFPMCIPAESTEGSCFALLGGWAGSGGGRGMAFSFGLGVASFFSTSFTLGFCGALVLAVCFNSGDFCGCASGFQSWRNVMQPIIIWCSMRMYKGFIRWILHVYYTSLLLLLWHLVRWALVRLGDSQSVSKGCSNSMQNVVTQTIPSTLECWKHAHAVTGDMSCSQRMWKYHTTRHPNASFSI